MQFLRLKCENPDRVFLLRGNHEDKCMNNFHGFKIEVEQKYGDLAPFVFKHVHLFYETLPCALLWESGKNAILCCHGGIELGVDLEALLYSDEHHVYQLIAEVDRERGVSASSRIYDLVQRKCEPSYLEAFKTPLDFVSSHRLGFYGTIFLFIMM